MNKHLVRYLLYGFAATLLLIINSQQTTLALSTDEFVYIPIVANGPKFVNYLETFDGDPSQPTPFGNEHWDVTVHSRDMYTWETLDEMQAQHGPNCEAPPATHTIVNYEDTVYTCKNHMMTALYSVGYGVIYLTPDHMVDFSQGEAVIRYDISTLRTSTRDWVDIWITPFEDNLQLPLQEEYPDLHGYPANSVNIKLTNNHAYIPSVFREFDGTVYEYAPGVMWWMDIHEFLTPDSRRRDTFELRISQTHLKFGMPDYNKWWIDLELTEPLTWTQGIVQLGHHSYNPKKDCNHDGSCGPSTYHWDNISINPAVPFTHIPGQQRFAEAGQETITFAQPSPAGSYLRFAGIGSNLEFSVDGGQTWMPARIQPHSRDTRAGEHFLSYFTEIPPGVTAVQLRGDNWWGGRWHTRDFSIWSLKQP